MQSGLGYGALGLGVLSFRVNTSFGTPSGTRNIKMTTDGKAEVSGQNQIPIDKEKLKEERKAKLKAITDAFEQ